MIIRDVVALQALHSLARLQTRHDEPTLTALQLDLSAQLLPLTLICLHDLLLVHII